MLVAKINYKSAYRRGILHPTTALQTATQLSDKDLAIITLRLTSGDAPCLFECGIMSETICNLGNQLLKWDNWDSHTLHASVQADIPKRDCFDNNVPFAILRELIVDVPIDPRGLADVYIHKTTGLTVDLPGTLNANRLKAAIPLAIEVAARPNDVNKPIPREPMVAQHKLKAEGGLAKLKVILGWLFNFRGLTVSLPKHKHIAWSGEIQSMLDRRRTTKKALELTIGRLGHIGFVIPWVFHFLSHLRTLLRRAQNRQTIALNKECKDDSVLMMKLHQTIY
jgi:hypothetical protein